MAARTQYPGIYLEQRTIGGTFYVRFFTRHTGQRQQISKSLATDDPDIAKRIAREVSAFIHTQDQWVSPPTDLHPRTYDVLGIDPHDKDRLTVERSLRHLKLAAQFAGVDATPTTNRVNDVVDALQRRLDATMQERDAWKRRAIAAEGQLSKMGRRANKDRAAIEGLTLSAALETWGSTLTGDADYVDNQKSDAGMFVRKFGERTALTDIAGQESKIDLWIRSLKRVVGTKESGKQTEKAISASRRTEIRRVVLRFMRESGAELNGRAIKRPSIKDIRNDRGAIRWLTREQARRVAESIKDPYFADCFRIQLALGLRPDELLTLKKEDFSELGGVVSLTLSPLGALTLKEGSRTVLIPKTVRPLIAQRLKAHAVLFPYISRSGKIDGKPWPRAKSFDRRYLVALRAAGVTAGVPFKMDCRVARRTCATLLLGAGVAPKAVADILGDRLDTLIEHYGAAIPGTNDPSKAAI